jgi:hypothetical protein
LAGEPKLFLKLHIPYSRKLGLRGQLGWMYFQTKDWQNITRVFYHEATRKKDNPESIGKPVEFEKLFLVEEIEKYRLHNKTKLEIVTDKALKLAGYSGFLL